MMEGQPKYQCVSLPLLETNIWNCQSSYKLNLIRMIRPRNPLVVQWLTLCASTARGLGSIPGRGTKILHARLLLFSR